LKDKLTNSKSTVASFYIQTWDKVTIFMPVPLKIKVTAISDCCEFSKYSVSSEQEIY